MFNLRAEQKKLSRELDEKALATGQKTREQLSKGNGFLNSIKDRVRILYNKAKSYV